MILKRVCLLVVTLILISVVSCNITAGWKHVKHVEIPKSMKMSFTVALKQNNLQKLESLFWEVSNPQSEQYANYLSIEEIANIVAPSNDIIEKVSQFFKSFSSSLEIDLLQTRDVMRIHTTVEVVEKIFNVAVAAFSHPKTGRNILRSFDQYMLNEDIAEHIDLIHGISDFAPVSTRSRIVEETEAKANEVKVTYAAGREGSVSVTIVAKGVRNHLMVALESVVDTMRNKNVFHQVPLQHNQTTYSVTIPASNYVPYNVSVFADHGLYHDTFSTPVVCTPNVVPETLYHLYSIPSHSIVTHKQSTQCVVEFEQQYYSPSDLDMFLHEMGLPSAEVIEIGPNYPDNPGGEANLDIQWIMAMAPGASTTFWSIAANSTIEIDDILQWEYAIGNMTNPPLVNSLSYGMTEENVDKYLGRGYIARSDVEFQKLALRGLTIIIADGDAGAPDLSPPPMGQTKCNPLHADWPSQSPYITAIGSTYITPASEPICYMPQSLGGFSCLSNPLGEVAVSADAGMRWTTGGGFSNITTRPQYQEAVVSNYLKESNLLPPASYFNNSGRAYPEAVTVGHNLVVALSGKFTEFDGTSASAPIFAGIVTLLNDARLNANKKPLGFINQMMYQASANRPATFYDVTVGRNRCGDIGGVLPTCCQHGFTCGVGWDAVTGLGTPNYAELKDYVLGLQ